MPATASELYPSCTADDLHAEAVAVVPPKGKFVSWRIVLEPTATILEVVYEKRDGVQKIIRAREL